MCHITKLMLFRLRQIHLNRRENLRTLPWLYVYTTALYYFQKQPFITALKNRPSGSQKELKNNNVTM